MAKPGVRSGSPGKAIGGDDYEMGGDGWRFGEVTLLHELHGYMSYMVT